jgi:hypothetical protein
MSIFQVQQRQRLYQLNIVGGCATHSWKTKHHTASKRQYEEMVDCDDFIGNKISYDLNHQSSPTSSTPAKSKG